MLSQILRTESSSSIEDARQRIVREPQRSFRDLYQEIHGSVPAQADGEAGKAAATLWYEYLNANFVETLGKGQAHDTKASRVKDFDILSLCDTNAQWYCDTDMLELGVEAKLQGLVSQYRRVLFLGVSMCGFAALKFSHLADTVAVFGPQVDLRISHSRPGFLPEELAAASTCLQQNVARALKRGTRFEYHVASEDHLVYARLLPLPVGALIVHPIEGRIARVMERASVLAPLLVDLLAELQGASCQ